MKEEVEPAIAFCEVLRQQRISRGLTHKDLGLRAGLPGKYIYDLENGNEEPFLKTAHKLAAGLGLSTSGFLKIIERRIYGFDKEGWIMTREVLVFSGLMSRWTMWLSWR